MNKTKVVLDTSSLTYILDNQLIDKFTDWVRANKIKAIIPTLVIDEKISIDNEEKIIENLLSIGKILRILPHHIDIFIFIEDCFAMEFKNQLDSIPLEINDKKNEYQKIFSNKNKIIKYLENRPEDEKNAACKWKEKVQYEFDKLVIGRLRTKQKEGDPFYSPKNITKYIESFKRPSPEHGIHENMLEERNKINNKSYTAEFIISNKEKFPHYFTWMCLAEITVLGLLHPSGGSEFIQALQTDKGNWYDNGIATSATLCDLFLTEDKKLAIKCNYLYSKKLVNFETKKLSEIL